MSNTPNGFIREDPWRIFRIMAEFVESFETLSAAGQAVTREFFLSRGYVETRSQHAYELVFDKPAGSGRSGRALRIRLRLYQQADGSWRLVGRPMGVEAWRSDLESEVDVPHGASQIQDFLEEIRNRTESNHAP